ncbi:MAG: phBC6A51 family helix-turn-helix protein [Planctomycetota bacterium]
MAYIEASIRDPDVTPQDICRELGIHRSLYYKWRKNPQFGLWLREVFNSHFKGEGLQQVYSAMLRRGAANSPQDAKLYLERFDVDYKPTTAREHSLHAGQRPPDQDVQAAIAASKARAEAHKARAVASRVIDTCPGDRPAETGKEQQ